MTVGGPLSDRNILRLNSWIGKWKITSNPLATTLFTYLKAPRPEKARFSRVLACFRPKTAQFSHFPVRWNDSSVRSDDQTAAVDDPNATGRRFHRAVGPPDRGGGWFSHAAQQASRAGEGAGHAVGIWHLAGK